MSTKLLTWYKILLSGESQFYSDYIDMVSFQLFDKVNCKNTDIRDNGVTIATLIKFIFSVYSQMDYRVRAICDFFYTMAFQCVFKLLVKTFNKLYHSICICMVSPQYVP